MHRFIQLSNEPDSQSIHSFSYPSIHPFTRPSIHPSIQRFLSRGSYFCSVHKYLPRQLHLALSRGVYSAFVCIISNLLNIFHIINFNYLCSRSRSFSSFFIHTFFSVFAFELISIRKGKRVESKRGKREESDGRALLSLITSGGRHLF